MNGRSSAKASIRKKKIETFFSSLPSPKGAVRLSPPGKSASIAFWYQNAACRENPVPICRLRAEKKERRAEEQYNLHIRIDVGRTRRAGKGAASQRSAAVGLPAQADPRRKHPSRAPRKNFAGCARRSTRSATTSTSLRGNKRRVCQPHLWLALFRGC